jgi:transposase
VWAFDEGRFGLKTWCRRRWCPLGHRPPWRVSEAYRWTWVYVAIEPAHGRCHVCLFPRVTGDWLQLFLQSFRQETGAATVGVVLDNAPSHKNQAVQWPEGITPLFLPPYSPELNPAEQVFRVLRQALSNRIFADEDDLEAAITTALRRFWDHPEVVIRLTDYPWWQSAIDANPPLSP